MFRFVVVYEFGLPRYITGKKNFFFNIDFVLTKYHPTRQDLVQMQFRKEGDVGNSVTRNRNTGPKRKRRNLDW